MKPIITVTMNPALDKTVTVEQFIPAGLNRIKTVRTDPGGKGINVAKVLKQFGAPVSAWGIQAGHEGRMLMEMLEAAQIPAHFLEAEGKSRTNLKVVDEETRQTTELNEPGVTPSESLLTELVSQLDASMRDTSLLVLAGSLPPGTPPDFYGRLIAIASTHGVPTILDADGTALAAGLEAVPYAVKPNIHELEALLGRTLTTDEQVIEAARGLQAGGIKLVAVSMGAAGSILVGEQEVYRARPFPITPMSTVGAGDSMVAAMAYCLSQGKTLEETARWTTAAGTVTASKPGTEVCSLAEVQAKLAAVSLEHL